MQNERGVLADGNEELISKIGFYAVIERRLTEAQSRGFQCGGVLQNNRRLRNEALLLVLIGLCFMFLASHL